MRLSGWLAIVDGVVALALMLSVPRQRKNKASVIVVAAVLLGIAGWLSVLALDEGPREQGPAQLPNGRLA